jgi:hypothetical protein
VKFRGHVSDFGARLIVHPYAIEFDVLLSEKENSGLNGSSGV